MAITLTEAAARHVIRYLARRGKGFGVRLGVQVQALPPDHVWLMKQGEVRALPVEEAR